MTTLHVHHHTRYRYSAPVSFGVHRLMLRPRDGHDMRILDSSLTVSPPATIDWAFDTFGNSVAFATFTDMAAELVIESELLLRRFVYDSDAAEIAAHSVAYPFSYGDEDTIDLAPLMRVHCPDDGAAIRAWMEPILQGAPALCVDMLQQVAAAIHDTFTYNRREEQGVQTPGETLASRSGTCRDYAYLFMEAARQLGFAARFVTGYLYDPAADKGAGEALSGGGATHAWADVFVPNAGWTEFDPTNRIVAGKNLVRVATTRTPAQAMPVEGSFTAADGADFLGMDITVHLSETGDTVERLADRGAGGQHGQSRIA